MPQPGKTYSAKPSEITTTWYVIDARGQTLGRLAANVAKLLKGKHKPIYTPHLNTGDHVIVVNASRVLVTGGKLDGKTYARYSGYPGGLRTRTLREEQERDPSFPVYNAVRGMLQRNTLGAEMLKRLRVFAGPEHEHSAQKPRAVQFNDRGDIDL